MDRVLCLRYRLCWTGFWVSSREWHLAPRGCLLGNYNNWCLVYGGKPISHPAKEGAREFYTILSIARDPSGICLCRVAKRKKEKSRLSVRGIKRDNSISPRFGLMAYGRTAFVFLFRFLRPKKRGTAVETRIVVFPVVASLPRLIITFWYMLHGYAFCFFADSVIMKNFNTRMTLGTWVLRDNHLMTTLTEKYLICLSCFLRPWANRNHHQHATGCAITSNKVVYYYRLCFLAPRCDVFASFFASSLSNAPPAELLLWGFGFGCFSIFFDSCLCFKRIRAIDRAPSQSHLHPDIHIPYRHQSIVIRCHSYCDRPNYNDHSRPLLSNYQHPPSPSFLFPGIRVCSSNPSRIGCQ